jgi:hypothetical protein
LSGWQDSNLRPSGPKPDALTGLRYTPYYPPKPCEGGFPLLNLTLQRSRKSITIFLIS